MHVKGADAELRVDNELINSGNSRNNITNTKAVEDNESEKTTS
jgi:hypothetical protein